MRTIKPADNGFLVVSLPNDDLNVRVCACEGLELCEEEGACGVGGGPFVAVFENEFSDLGNKSNVTIGRACTQRSA